MRVVAITRLFPNPLEPLWCLFNKQQLAALGRLDDVEVLGVIPWFPGARVVPSSAAGRLMGVPHFEHVDGLRVEHPRYLFVPKVPAASAALYAASLAGDVWRRRREADVLLGAWAYPDGAATVMLARACGLPSVVKVHGSDLNVIARIASVRAQLKALLPRATRMVAVSRALADELAALGVPRAQIAVVPNGVDASLFFPRDRAEARAQLGLPADRRIVVYVGRLVRDKGLFELVDAIAASSPELLLLLVGDGVARGELEERARPLGARVRFAGARPLDEIPRWLAACDTFVLPSWNEGTPNVLLEALACGRRAVATRVGGIPDVMTSPALGEMVPPKDPTALAAALARQAYAEYAPSEVAAAGGRGGWAESAAKLHEVLEDARAAHRR